MSISIKDQLGREVTLASPAIRIVCLVPSITELLADIGLTDQLVGRTKFCIYPTNLKETTPQIGGTKQVHFDKIKTLNPDLIIANKEENTKEIVDKLAEYYPVYVSSIQTIHSALHMMEDIGKLTGKEEETAELVDEIEAVRVEWHKRTQVDRKCIYMIWKDPLMTIGIDTFIFHMLQEAGFSSVVYDFRYPTISNEYIKKSEAEFILLSNEPFPFEAKHQDIFQKEFPNKKNILVDGSYFSWYGSRMKDAYPYFEQLLLSL